MNGVHDMGGMHGFGRVQIEKDEPVFHEEWEGRAWGLWRQVPPPPFQPGWHRAIIESMEPARYLSSSYYERWLEVAHRRALDVGWVTEEEIAERIEFLRQHPDTPLPRREDPAVAERIRNVRRTQRRPEAEGPPPRFCAGDQVRARNLNWDGHSRLPRYIRGKHGVVVRVNGRYAIEDAHADQLGPNPQTVYTVGFDGMEVWGPGAEPNLRVYLELWEGYLEPA